MIFLCSSMILARFESFSPEACGSSNSFKAFSLLQ